MGGAKSDGCGVNLPEIPGIDVHPNRSIWVKTSGLPEKVGLYDRSWQILAGLGGKFVSFIVSRYWTQAAYGMNIYCEFTKERIRIKIDGDEIAVQLRDDFYPRKMFKDAITNNKLEGFVFVHKKALGIFDRLKYRFEKNRVLILVHQEIQKFVTIRQIYNYASLFLEGKHVYIIRQKRNFNCDKLEELEKISHEYINSRYHDDTIIAALTEENRTHANSVGGKNK